MTTETPREGMNAWQCVAWRCRASEEDVRTHALRLAQKITTATAASCLVLCRTDLDACVAGECRGVPSHDFVDSPPSVLEETWPVRSYSMGYSPRYREWWFVEYTSGTPNWAYRCGPRSLLSSCSSLRFSFETLLLEVLKRVCFCCTHVCFFALFCLSLLLQVLPRPQPHPGSLCHPVQLRACDCEVKWGGGFESWGKQSGKLLLPTKQRSLVLARERPVS